MNNKTDNLTVFQPELSCYVISSNGSIEVNDLFIWGKLYNTSVYQATVNKLGYEKYSTKLVWNEDYIMLFSISNIAQSYKFVNKYGYFHFRSSSTSSGAVDYFSKRFSEIFFFDIIFDFGKDYCKKQSALKLIEFGIKNDYIFHDKKFDEVLENLIKKLIQSEFIEKQLKTKIKELFGNRTKYLNNSFSGKL